MSRASASRTFGTRDATFALVKADEWMLLTVEPVPWQEGADIVDDVRLDDMTVHKLIPSILSPLNTKNSGPALQT